jgi:hypothetical protein
MSRSTGEIEQNAAGMYVTEIIRAACPTRLGAALTRPGSSAGTLTGSGDRHAFGRTFARRHFRSSFHRRKFMGQQLRPRAPIHNCLVAPNQSTNVAFTRRDDVKYGIQITA